MAGKSIYSVKFCINSLVFFASCVLPFVIGEVVLRYHPLIQTYSAIKPWSGFSEQFKRDYFISDNYLGYKPGSAWSRKGVFGFQNGKEYLPLKQGMSDVIILGDSVVQDRRLFNALNTLIDKNTTRLWNAGIGGYSTTQEAAYLEREISLPPATKTVLLVYCLNDYLPSMVVNAGKSKNSVPTVEFPLIDPLTTSYPKLFHYSALYRSLFVLFHYSRSLSNNDMIRSNFKYTEMALARIHSYLAARGISLLVVVYPFLTEYSPDSFMKISVEEVTKSLQKLGIDYLDMHTVMPKQDFKKYINNNDIVHPNYAAHNLFANFILEQRRDLFSAKTFN